MNIDNGFQCVCGHNIRDESTIKCPECDIIVISNYNNQNKRFHLNEIVFWPRKSGGMAEKGKIVEIKDFNSRDKIQLIRIKYAINQFRDDRYDEYVSFHQVYKSLDDFPSTRNRKTMTLLNISSQAPDVQSKVCNSMLKCKYMQVTCEA